ncbi:CYFA0S01e07272g1_1 [Cyberlindnera fabianii]|uniref:CYFA0S01e07272g1_1 n=1 Tax=Cyberlindnera fabianii TaxID=36022 RepID=A0A061AIY8_CYBFA|nr:CYFA0S01e07272g1_1 [Cyberlindnera fabianii]
MPKVLVLHPDAAELPQLASKVNALQQKSGPFVATILIGDSMPEQRTQLTDVKFENPVYFASGANGVEYLRGEAEDIEANLSYMGHYNIFTTSDDITIAFITGDEQILEERCADILSRLEGKTIDILITYQWSNVIATEKQLFFGNTNVDKIVEKVQPKYHFAVGPSSGKFFERAPFLWDESQTVTRFISLGKFGSGEKWIYAFNLNKDANQEVPSNITSNPFLEFHNKQLNEEKQQQTTSIKRPHENDSTIAHPPKKHVKKVVVPENCFFCLSNPKLEAHMIVSIGEHAYLTIAKGPLTRPTSTMKFSGHCIIIPIAHIPALLPTEEDESVVTLPLYNEILRYQISLVKMFNSFQLSTVFFQINRTESVHFHIQAYPIAEDFLFDFEKVLNKTQNINNTKYTRSASLEFERFESTSDEKYLGIINSKKDYITFTIFHGGIDKQEVFISQLLDDKVVDLQFGRRVMAHLLQTPKRLKWDKCQQGQKVEEHETEMFKASYKDYDFTLDL